MENGKLGLCSNRDNEHDNSKNTRNRNSNNNRNSNSHSNSNSNKSNSSSGNNGNSNSNKDNASYNGFQYQAVEDSILAGAQICSRTTKNKLRGDSNAEDS